MFEIDEDVGEVVINEAGRDIDLRVESDSNTKALFVRGSDGGVGIGTTVPMHGLSINTSMGLSGAFYDKDGSKGTSAQVLHSDGSKVYWGTDDSGGGSHPVTAVANGSNNRVATFSSSSALNGEAGLIFDGSVLDVEGTVGIGTDATELSLDVLGKIKGTFPARGSYNLNSRVLVASTDDNTTEIDYITAANIIYLVTVTVNAGSATTATHGGYVDFRVTVNGLSSPATPVRVTWPAAGGGS